MATYQDKGQWRYRTRVTLASGKVKRISGTPDINTRREAERAERAHIERALNGTDEVIEVPTLAAFSTEYLDVYLANNAKPSSRNAAEINLRLHLLPEFGRKKLDAITVRDIERYKSRKTDETNPKRIGEGTLKNTLITLSSLLNVAKDWKLISDVPEINWPTVARSKFDFLTFTEADALLEELPREWRTMVLVMLRTGIRIGEARALRWEDVDLINGKLRIHRNAVDVKQKDGSYKTIIGTTKGGKERPVPLSGQALQALRAHPQRSELVFPGEDGGILGRSCGRSVLERASKASVGRPITWHVFRHTFASHLVMRGVSLKAVQELMGHASIELTMRYSHLTPDIKERAVALLDTPAPAPQAVDDKERKR